MQQNKKFNVYTLTTIGIMAALIFVSSRFMQVFIPITGDDPTRVHAGNGLALLSGLILGPVKGALAATIGFVMHNLTSAGSQGPSSIPWTILFRFSSIFICGAIAHMGGRKAKSFGFNLTACIVASIAYMIMFLGRNFIVDYFMQGFETQVVLTRLFTRTVSSTANAVFGIILATVVYQSLYTALKSSNLLNKIRGYRE
ncbi:MAG: ECF transporter S component [Defluviitaleaceae bacterium]|nr:ECF transporter S component [Defluviitaleaceae bacterium]